MKWILRSAGTVALLLAANMALASDLWHAPLAAALLQNEAAPPAADPKALQQLLERITRLEAEVERLKTGAAPNAKPAGTEVFALVETAHIGVVYRPMGQVRFLALQVIVANTTSKPVTILQEQISVELDGQVRPLETLPPDIAAHSFQYKNQPISLQKQQPEKSRTIPAGSQQSFWLVFARLPAGTTIPKCKLTMTLGDGKKEIDVNAVQRAMLGLQTERIGPRGCLGLLTITGTVTLFNTQSLVDELESLMNQKVTRAVVRWGTDAPQPDPQVLTWLQSSAAAPGQARNDLLPSIPGGLREFHLVRFSEKETASVGYRGNMPGPLRNHASSTDAVGAALRTAFVALPRDELIDEVRKGHPLVRAAALTFGGARLDTQHLPQIFEWINDADPDVQRAAIQTLSHFGEPEAVEKLVFYVRRNQEPLASAAVESLAGSRFGAAHEALLNLLANETPESRNRIIQVLARYPRAVWSETLFEYTTDSAQGLNLDAVKALVQVGHPKLVDVLEAGLKSDNKALRDFCFQTLANRLDERSEKLAVDFTLAHLKSNPPEGAMTQLLARTKESQALPLLLDQLERVTGDRTSVITLLVQIGDQSVGDKLAEKYPMLQSSSEKAQVLNGLKQFRHPKFREFAGAALLSGDNALVSMAAVTLMQEGHPDGEKLLIAALEKQTTSHLLHNITNALANYGTATARAALQRAKESSDANKRNYATNALLQIRQRSPGFQYVNQGVQRLQMPIDPKDEEAKKQQEKDALEFFELAMQIDPLLPEAFAARGKLFLRQDRLADAGKDFEKALELKLEPEDNEVVTGLALARVVAGKLDEAIKLIEDGRERHKSVRGGLYIYNCACVYSRCLQYLKDHPEVADSAMRQVTFREKALADLKQSVKQGFTDYDWIAKDPDFKVLREDPEFQKILSTKPAEESESNESKSDQ